MFLGPGLVLDRMTWLSQLTSSNDTSLKKYYYSIFGVVSDLMVARIKCENGLAELGMSQVLGAIRVSFPVAVVPSWTRLAR
jgi:hypothetical protein